MRSLFQNIWLLSLGVFCFIPWAWYTGKQDRMMATAPVEQALAWVGVTLTALCAILYLVFTLQGRRFALWAFAPSYSEHVGDGARPGASARLMLRLGVAVGALTGIVALPVGLLLLVWDTNLQTPEFAARRMAIHESRSLRLDVSALLAWEPFGDGPLALALAVGESDVQDLAESEIIAYELYPRRVERVWLKDCEAGIGTERAQEFDAILYQCNRGDAYSWRDPAAPLPDYWPDTERAP